MSPLDVIISSGGERASDEKKVDKKDWREWWEEERKEENVLPSPFFLPVMYKKSPCTVKVNNILEMRLTWTY